ncbi:hypothetical protein GCM10010300_59360 [Streptomyces olivaceoviridis]|uniref:hypothetical protein n=1 Tax=Streptomyces olivaceoviridis TaxID=1921 RepID=UPI0019C7E00B|nr:hypothetical protein GCM10010300_59360 [Streptomyces olivaceoviridis]
MQRLGPLYGGRPGGLPGRYGVSTGAFPDVSAGASLEVSIGVPADVSTRLSPNAATGATAEVSPGATPAVSPGATPEGRPGSALGSSPSPSRDVSLRAFPVGLPSVRAGRQPCRLGQFEVAVGSGDFR